MLNPPPIINTKFILFKGQRVLSIHYQCIRPTEQSQDKKIELTQRVVVRYCTFSLTSDTNNRKRASYYVIDTKLDEGDYLLLSCCSCLVINNECMSYNPRVNGLIRPIIKYIQLYCLRGRARYYYLNIF